MRYQVPVAAAQAMVVSPVLGLSLETVALQLRGGMSSISVNHSSAQTLTWHSGSSSAHCGTGCQSQFGNCGSGSKPVSDNARCGSQYGGKTCQGSAFGDCCSQHGYVICPYSVQFDLLTQTKDIAEALATTARPAPARTTSVPAMVRRLLRP